MHNSPRFISVIWLENMSLLKMSLIMIRVRSSKLQLDSDLTTVFLGVTEAEPDDAVGASTSSSASAGQ